MENEKPLMPQDREFMNHRDDFVALADGKETGWLDGVVEDTLFRLLPKTLHKVKTPSHVSPPIASCYRSLLDN